LFPGNYCIDLERAGNLHGKGNRLKGVQKMRGFPIGIAALILLSIVIYFGLAHRVLDRMRLTDKAALVILGALIAGSFVTIPLASPPLRVTLNVGGALVPVGVALYVLSRAGTEKEWGRAIAATIVTAVAVILVNTLLISGDAWQTGRDVIDPLYVFPLVAGVVAYLAGRSRRSAFIAATLGVLLTDIYDVVYLSATNTPGAVDIGGAGGFDAIVLSGLAAVLLAEVVGEARERLQGGPKMEGRPRELLEGLRKPNPRVEGPRGNGADQESSWREVKWDKKQSKPIGEGDNEDHA
jgi:uncharacterized membrane protein